MSRRARLVTTVVLALALVVALAAPAFAHVEIESVGPVSADGTVNASLSVPNERTDAGTTEIALVFPESPALQKADAGAVAGWTATVTRRADGSVDRVTWKGGPLSGDTRISLPVTIGAVPAGTKTIEFKALQTYDDGQQVAWIEQTPPGGEEPEHPAPVLEVSGTSNVAPPTSSTTGKAANATTSTERAAPASSGDDGLSGGAIAAIVAGAIVVAAGIAYLVARGRRHT